MQFEVVEIAPDTNRVALAGRLDAAGVEAGELRFTAAVASVGRHAIVDFSDVSFIGSLGVRLLLAVARVLERRGRRMVLYGIGGQVREVFDNVSISELIPVVADEVAARQRLAA
jgi:anti-anti-sigma factor